MLSCFVIRSDEGYWNNRIGWVENIEDATIYTQTLVKYMMLPIGKNVCWEEIQCNGMK